MHYIDVSGKKFHLLTALEISTSKRGKDGSIYWKCQCDCGKITEVRSDALRKGYTKSCGCMPRVDLKGKRFGMLIVIKDSGKRVQCGQRKWTCKCDCGNYSEPTTIRLTNGMTRSCGCLRKRKGVDHHSYTGVGDLSGEMWNRVLSGAKIRKIKVHIDINYAWLLFNKQLGKCSLTGLPISFDDKTASLDRIDSLKPYEIGNVHWVHKAINRMKWNLTISELKYWCRKVANFRG